MNTHLAIERNPEHQRTIQACFSSPLPHAENWTMDNYLLKFESWAHLNLDEINQRLNINYHQTDRKKCLQFCIFSFVMLNTPSLCTASPTCNTDPPLTPGVCVEPMEPGITMKHSKWQDRSRPSNFHSCCCFSGFQKLWCFKKFGKT